MALDVDLLLRAGSSLRFVSGDDRAVVAKYVKQQVARRTGARRVRVSVRREDEYLVVTVLEVSR